MIVHTLTMTFVAGMKGGINPVTSASVEPGGRPDTQKTLLPLDIIVSRFSLSPMWQALETWWYGHAGDLEVARLSSEDTEFVFSLPLDVWHEILRRIDDSEVKQLTCVSKGEWPLPPLTTEFQFLITNDGLWQLRFCGRRHSSLPKVEMLRKVSYHLPSLRLLVQQNGVNACK